MGVVFIDASGTMEKLNHRSVLHLDLPDFSIFKKMQVILCTC